ncbi:glycosyltransferase family A protein [Psychroserpens sp. Hel_I_66]|uniref:glycosyltransferase family A protein n=1 Tax=Psychroserpens sp. Hel_I_66 TaxID=1250004 RepID=UPI00068ED75A|nr:glycosyltransferase family 2 protein [Psychroserpens sp. Hel_I_66]
MSVSIITPHYNDFKGLKQIYKYLREQTYTAWDWVIVDDKSDSRAQIEIDNWYKNLEDVKVQLYLNTKKTNASVCRNLGAELAKSETLIFLDADDKITPKFLSHRDIKFLDFAVFKNTAVYDSEKGEIPLYDAKKNYLNYFLSAKFIWPITAILWDKNFFKSLGGFHPELPRLQDVELAIRALLKSSNYCIVDKPIDFYYCVNPIRERKNFVQPVCDAVYLFVSKLLQKKTLTKHQLSLVSGYYFLCLRYFERSGSKSHIALVRRNLILFYHKKHISFFTYLLGSITLKFYKINFLTGKQFIRISRVLFKPSTIH